VLTVEGDFSRGDVVACTNEAGTHLVRGIMNYSAAEARLIARKASSEIEAVLGYVAEPELMHRDNMVKV
jgi:glutamate 5-kinase